MKKRSINKQQASRIEKKQLSLQQSALKQDSKALEGLIIARFNKHALVETSEGRCIHCYIKPSIDSLVAGDKVVWQQEDTGKGLIVSRYPRQVVLARYSEKKEYKAVAANMTQVIIVIAAIPEVSWLLLDSYLIMAEHLHLKAAIIFNKIDVPGQHENIKKRLKEQYASLGYSVLFTSTHRVSTLKDLATKLADETSVFVGQSGVGKSSLISSFLPSSLSPTIGALSSSTELGCHTTSNAYLYHLPSGGDLIDSPGIRTFGLWQMSYTDLAKGYREFLTYLPACKFRDCNHFSTPHCAIIEAVKNKNISNDRYQNYVKICHQLTSSNG